MGSVTQMELSKVNRPLAALIAAVTVAGIGVLAFGAARHTSDELSVLLTLIVLGALAERYAVGLFDSDVSVGVVAVLVAAAIALSGGEPVLARWR